jgi:hypothetical protein
MATVAGLTRELSTGSGDVTRAEGRAQTAPNRPPPDLQPQAAPVSIYSRPEDNTRQAGAGLDQIVSALGRLNPALNNFASTQADDMKAQQEAAAENKIGGMTFEEAQKGVQEGSIPELQNPWFKAAFMKQFGQRVALKKAQELADQYSNGFNKDGGNVEQLIAGTAKPVLEQYGNDKHFSSGFNGVFAPAAARLRNDQAGYQAQTVNNNVRQGIYEIGTAIIGDGISKGQSADQIVANIRSTYAGNKQLLNVPYAEQDAEVYRMAETLTKGISTSSNPQLQKEIVDKLLNDERIAPDGKNLGKLADNRLYASKAVQLLDASDKELRQHNKQTGFDSFNNWYGLAQTGEIGPEEYEQLKREHAETPGRFTDAQVVGLKHMSDTALEQRRKEVATLEEKQRTQALIAAQHQEILTNNAALASNGSLWAVKDREVMGPEGKPKTLSAKDQREEVVDQYLRTPRPVTQQIDWFSRQGEENPQFTDLLKRGYLSATPATVSGNKLPDSLDKSIDLYSQMYAQAPQLLGKHLDDAGMNFYEAVRFGMQSGGFDKKTAVVNALEVNKDPTKYDSPYWKQKFDDISNAVNRTVPGMFMNGAPMNAGEIAPQIEQSAKYFSKLGANPKTAVEEAVKRVQANYVNVNDYLVKTGDRAIPASFPQMAKGFIDDYVAKHGTEEGVTAADLTVQPIGNAAGEWRIVHKRSPGMMVDGPEGIFNLPKLMDAAKAREETARAAALSGANDARTRDLIKQYDYFDKEEYVLNNGAAGIGKADRAKREKALADFRKSAPPRPAAPPPATVLPWDLNPQM